MENNTSYIPGMCNINKAEIARRRKTMWFGIWLSIILLIAMLVMNMNVLLRLVLFVPIFIAVIGCLQSKNKFCVGYAASGRQNATEGSNAAETVDKEAHAIDMQRARIMNLQAVMITAAIILFLLLLPNDLLINPN